MRRAGRLVHVGVVLSVLAVWGCSTPYQPRGAGGGGYSETQLDRTTFRVEVQGNEGTSRDVIDAYLIYRCAELTLQVGYDHFVILEFVARPLFAITQYVMQSDKGTTREAFSTGRYGATATIRVVKDWRRTDGATRLDPEETIRVIRGETGGRGKPPHDVLDAREVLRVFGPRVKP